MINLLADKIEKLNTTIDIVQCLEYFDFKRNHSSEYFLIYKIFNNGVNCKVDLKNGWSIEHTKLNFGKLKNMTKT